MDADGVILAAGRALIGALFLFAGVRHFFIAGVLVPIIEARGARPGRPILYAGSAFEAAMGLLLILGLYVVPAALGLIGFLALATLLMVNFWDKTGPERETLQNFALNNMAIAGGLLVLVAVS